MGKNEDILARHAIEQQRLRNELDAVYETIREKDKEIQILQEKIKELLSSGRD